MSPKQAAIITFLFLAISLTLTLSYAQFNCPGFSSVSDVLRRYELPGGLFPNNIRSFSCTRAGNGLRLTVQLNGVCRVTRTMLGVSNVVVNQPQMSANINQRQLTNIRGMSVTVTVNGNRLIQGNVVEVNVFQTSAIGRCLQFVTTQLTSPCFPVALFPNSPPNCDRALDDSSGFEFSPALLALDAV